MIQSEIRFFSPVLGMRVAMSVLLPESMPGPFATLYLLHGLSDDHTVWGRLTTLELDAWDLPLAIVMPQGFRGFYTKNENGPDYAKYVIDDVIGTAERVLPLRKERTARGIGGLSMGGYGALRLGLAYPDRFASIHSHSGALLYGTIGRTANSALGEAEYARVFGVSPADTDHDLTALVERLPAHSPVPRILIDCGVDDFLIEQNRAFHAALNQARLSHVYREYPGAHNWQYWNEHVREAMQFHMETMTIA